jgi:hypothetical protein
MDGREGVFFVAAVRVAHLGIVYNDFMLATALTKEYRKIDQYSDVELMSAFWEYFGGRRGVGILGWCFVGAMSGANDPGALRAALEQRGLSKTALYQALDALRAFQEELEGRSLPRRDSSFAIHLLKRLSAVSCL